MAAALSRSSQLEMELQYLAADVTIVSTYVAPHFLRLFDSFHMFRHGSRANWRLYSVRHVRMFGKGSRHFDVVVSRGLNHMLQGTCIPLLLGGPALHFPAEREPFARSAGT